MRAGTLVIVVTTTVTFATVDLESEPLVATTLKM
jgi:hypothetical protein